MKTDLFHFDLECCGEYPDFKTFKENDERGANLFESKFKKMNWDSKCESINEAYIDNAGIISAYGKICCISFGFIDNGKYRISSYNGENEFEIVNSFNELLKKIEVKNFSLCGFRIFYYDIPWLLHKLHKYGIKPANIIYMYDKKPWESRVVDLSDDWKGKFAWSGSFDEMLYELGIESPKSDMSGSDVHSKYWNGDHEEIKTYCEKDITSSINASLRIY